MSDYVQCIKRGRVALAGKAPGAARTEEMEEKQWNPHPAFAGVALKHVLTGEDTGGTMSLHLVRIDPDCAIGAHVHENNWELHQVVGGEGQCLACGERMDYAPGVQASLPRGEAHEVRAGGRGLMLLATFAPPLL